MAQTNLYAPVHYDALGDVDQIAGTGNNDGNVYIKPNPGPDDLQFEAGYERIPGANRAEALAHELLGHEWGAVFGGNAMGTAANKQDAVNAENAVRATDPTRGQKAQHDHY